MAILEGQYDEGGEHPATAPRTLHVTGSHDDTTRARKAIHDNVPNPETWHSGPRQNLDANGNPQGEKWWRLSTPASREAVRAITRAVNVECYDPRLVDWMRGGNDA